MYRAQLIPPFSPNRMPSSSGQGFPHAIPIEVDESWDYMGIDSLSGKAKAACDQAYEKLSELMRKGTAMSEEQQQDGWTEVVDGEQVAHKTYSYKVVGFVKRFLLATT